MAREHLGLTDDELFEEDVVHNIWFETYEESRKHYKLYHGRLRKRGYSMTGAKTLPVLEGESLAKITGISYLLRFSTEKLPNEIHHVDHYAEPNGASDTRLLIHQPFDEQPEQTCEQTCQLHEG